MLRPMRCLVKRIGVCFGGAADCRAITASQIPDVLEEWRHPQHEAFTPRNAWSLFNAFTAVYRELNPHTALGRGEALHGLFDAVVGMS